MKLKKVYLILNFFFSDFDLICKKKKTFFTNTWKMNCGFKLYMNSFEWGRPLWCVCALNSIAREGWPISCFSFFLSIDLLKFGWGLILTTSHRFVCFWLDLLIFSPSTRSFDNEQNANDSPISFVLRRVFFFASISFVHFTPSFNVSQSNR